MRTKTFQELTDDIGSAAIYNGTNVDQALQGVLLDWLFDYRLCDPDQNVFLRYYRRRLNNLYPKYLEQVRILTMRDNFDPFVTEYFQDILNKNGQEIGMSTKSVEGSVTGGNSVLHSGGTTTTRTPNLVNTASEESTDSMTGSVSGTERGTVNGSNVEARDTQFSRNVTSADTKSGTANEHDRDVKSAINTSHLIGEAHENKNGYDKVTKGGDDTTTTTERFKDRYTEHEHKENSSSNATSATDNIGIAYPEANLGNNAIPLDIGNPANDGGSAKLPSSKSVNYASSESIGLSKSHTDATVDFEKDKTKEYGETETKAVTDYNSWSQTDYNSGVDTNEDRTTTDSINELDDRTKNATTTETANGSESETSADTGSITNTEFNQTATNRSEQQTETKEGTKVSSNQYSGNEITEVVDGRRDVTTNNTTNAEEENASNNVNTSEVTKNVHKGRTESVADIVPRAIKAIIAHNELMWFVEAVKVCFDCVD